MSTINRGPVTDYQLLYRALVLRCSQVAEKLRTFSIALQNSAVSDQGHRGGEYLESLADTLDTPISTQDAATTLHLGDTP